MKPNVSHYKTADQIIKTHGLNFALASAAGKNMKDLRTARKMLYEAIAYALAAEMKRAYDLGARDHSRCTGL